ncbi:Glutamate Aspartate transport system permease protein GltK [Caballeronia sordidicola]|uniref:Glutamate Aspartate transport system permease protein GltK n=1 Tax=Caballeronia sordidicola TaxID=196367 RepID=A0A226XCB3_CABSO|nr:Glutamate Aspartate transport system permease protein GltK [Caballeronia sordidicola]
MGRGARGRLVVRHSSHCAQQEAGCHWHRLCRHLSEYPAARAVLHLVSRDTRVAARFHRQLVQAVAAKRAVLFVIHYLPRVVHRSTRVRASALGHCGLAARTARRWSRHGVHRMADLPLHPDARRVPDHRAAAHVGVPERVQELGGGVDHRVARIVGPGAATCGLHRAVV